MATFVLKDVAATFGGTDLSDKIESISLNLTADAPEDTAMSDTSRSYLAGGLKDGTCTVTFVQDFAASEVDATMFAALATSIAIAAKPTSGAISSTNPEYQVNGILTDYSPIDGTVGDTAKTSVTLQLTGDVTRDVTP